MLSLSSTPSLQPFHIRFSSLSDHRQLFPLFSHQLLLFPAHRDPITQPVLATFHFRSFISQSLLFTSQLPHSSLLNPQSSVLSSQFSILNSQFSILRPLFTSFLNEPANHRHSQHRQILTIQHYSLVLTLLSHSPVLPVTTSSQTSTML